MARTKGAALTVVQPGKGDVVSIPRGQMHAMWNAGSDPGRIIEVIAPGGGFESYFRELGELLMSGQAAVAPGSPLHESAEFTELAARYGLTPAAPDWLDDVVRRYGLSPATH
ncbi:hypothetical protein AU198_04430 [Mycobacterium sp. GA-1199]|uniref:hypothetical protein n=1 Tax=Mycobacterium sp. GA-1199 TaxID=1772287 RepID=UPI000747EC1F|nr:hypothetical protein [Mycobacterium sp. GA-1199]KUI47250.1 hypothetical protein AU198_04430 [Mycobacterium sp. GA-1199]